MYACMCFLGYPTAQVGGKRLGKIKNCPVLFLLVCAAFVMPGLCGASGCRPLFRDVKHS